MKTKIVLLCALFNIVFSNIYAQTINHPFPQNKPYFQGSILPSTKTQAQLNTLTGKFYTTWKNAYLRHDCADSSQYYVYTDEAGGKGANKIICFSEAQGYGMQIMVLMAGVEKNAQPIYDGMYRFARSHPSSTSNYLMSWNILNGCITNMFNNNNNSATDGDMDITISLLMADSQWGSGGAINYREEAKKSVEAILKYEINSKKHTILLGDANLPDDYDYNDIRTSDFMPAYLKAFNAYFPDPEWTKVIDNTYSIFARVQQAHSPNTGLIPDFITYRKGKYNPAKAHYLEGPYDGNYYYNACRIPFRVGIDYLINGDIRAKKLLDPVNRWIELKSKYNADNICAGYYLWGQSFKDHHYANPSFVCPFTISAMVNKNNQTWLDDCWNTVFNFEFKDFQYYNNTLQMLSMIVISGNYWLPQP